MKKEKAMTTEELLARAAENTARRLDEAIRILDMDETSLCGQPVIREYADTTPVIQFTVTNGGKKFRVCVDRIEED